VEDASIAAFSIQLEAQSLGLASCWIQIRNRMHDEETKSEDYVKEYLNIPEDIRVDLIISLGYPGEKKIPIPKKMLILLRSIRENRRRIYLIQEVS